MPDDGSMAESAYELINSTDGESQDGRLTESVSSLDYPRPDDVQSLDGSDNAYQSDSGSSDNEDEQRSSASSIRYANEALQNPSTPPPTSSHQYRPPAQQATVPSSIEFVEGNEEDGKKDGSLFLGKISVKHTIRKFTEQETEVIAKAMHMPTAPGRLVATIRQTMSPDFLSTREPLRILYTGSPAARMEIIYKISSAICASGPQDENDTTCSRSSDGVFNIFPISGFGSSTMPDVHLLESSGRQIRVEDCTSAEEMVIEGAAFPGDTVYSLTVDKDKTYRSLFSPSGSVIQPKWPTLPHIAIFFCTEVDDEHARNTRAHAWEFMTRHGVPSIFISNNQCFTKPLTGRWRDFVDHHAVHLCLESRDPERPTLSQRLPIDLVSFLNIDARQMNRNLTYLTGLVESPAGLSRSDDTVAPPLSMGGKGYLEEHIPECMATLRTARRVAGEYVQQRRWLMPFAISLLTVLVGIVISALTVTPSGSPGHINPLSVVSPGFVPTVSSVVPTSAAATATTSVVVNMTSTETVKILNQKAPASTLASALSFAGLLSDKPSNKPSSSVANSETKTPLCTAEKFGSNSIVIHVPPTRQNPWFSSKGMSIQLLRGDKTVEYELSLNTGLVLVSIPPDEAYGILKLSVTSPKKPKINETFEIDFGKPIGAEFLEAGIRIIQGLSGEIKITVQEAGVYIHDVVEAAGTLREDTASVLDRAKEVSRTVQRYSQALRDEAATWAKESFNTEKVAGLLADAQERVMGRLGLPGSVRDEVDLAILKAQVASKAWWLKLQGRTQESVDYERKAAQFMQLRHTIRTTSGEKEKSGGRWGIWRCSESWRRSRCHR